VVRSSGKTVAKGLLIGAVALLISGIAGCEAGNNAPTLEFHPVPGGVYTTAGEISINDAFVLGAPLGDTVPAGSSASLFLSLYNGGSGDDTLVGASAPGYASSVQITNSTVSLPASAEVNMTGPEPSLVLSGLTKPLSNGQAIPLTLDFEHEGPVTLQVPVQAQASYYTTYSTPPASPTATPKTTHRAGTAPSPTASITTAPASPTAGTTPSATP
jgi:copper(I)-binding protein